jgi:hypothetical protein
MVSEKEVSIGQSNRVAACLTENFNLLLRGRAHRLENLVQLL